MKNILKYVFCIVIAVVLSLSLTSCKENAPENLWETALYTKNTELGVGDKTISVSVIADDKTVVFTISTDKEVLGDALIENNIVKGEEGPYGLYIKEVNGILADYDINQSYWSLTKAGEYLSTGADMTGISDGDKFELVYTK